MTKRWNAIKKLADQHFISEHFEEVDMSERGMDLVRAKRSDVARKVKEAREKHWREFEKVHAKFLTAATKLMGQRIEEAKAGKHINMHFNIIVPVDHTKDYDRVLAMLEMSVDDVIELTRKDFQRYVLNEWDWYHEWEGTKSSYGVGDEE